MTLESITTLFWAFIGAAVALWFAVKIARWIVSKFAPVQRESSIPSVAASPMRTALDQRREYLDACGKAGTCAVVGCGSGATEKMPAIVQTFGFGNGFVRWLGHKPQDRYHVSTDVGSHNLLCDGHATIAVSMCEFEVAERNSVYAAHCREQAIHIVEFLQVDMLDALSTGQQAAAKRVLQKPGGAAPKLAVVPQAANGGES